MTCDHLSQYFGVAWREEVPRFYAWPSARPILGMDQILRKTVHFYLMELIAFQRLVSLVARCNNGFENICFLDSANGKSIS